MSDTANINNATIQKTLPRVTPHPELMDIPYPLTDLQRAYRLGEGSLFPLGNMQPHTVFEFEWDNLNVERFAQAWQRLVVHHPALRAFINADDQWQILPVVQAYKPELNDLSTLAPVDQDQKLTQIKQCLIENGPNTNNWPLFQIVINQLSNNKAIIYINMSLVVLDGRSLGILIRDLIKLYENPNAELEPLTCSIRDIITGMFQLRETQPYLDAKQYWLNRIANLPGPPELPMTKDPLAVKKSLLSYVKASVPQAEWEALQKTAIENGIIPVIAIYTAFAKILSVWSSSEDFCVSILHFNCPPIHKEIMKVIGNLSSTSLLEAHMSKDKTFIEIAKELQQQFQQDLANYLFSGVEVLQERNRRLKTMNVAMPIAFASMKNPFDKSAFNFCQLKDINVQTPHVTLDCGVLEQVDMLLIRWAVLAEMFPPNMLEDMITAMQELLLGLAKDKSKWHEPLVVTLNSRQQQIRKSANETSAPLSDETLHGLVVKQVQKSPTNTAIVTENTHISYAELESFTNQIAHLLQKNNAQPNKLIAVVMEKGWEQAAAVLGILKAGAAYLPIDASFPQERIEKLLKAGEVQIVLTQPHIQNKFSWPNTVNPFVISKDSPVLKTEAASALSSMQTKHDLAYVIFTSGSTGEPKGVAISHEGAVNTILDINQRFQVTNQDKVLAISELNFDLSVWDIFGTWAAGGTLVYPRPLDTRDPQQLANWVQTQGITIWNSVPAFLQMFQEYTQDQAAEAYKTLRLFMLSGDWIPLSLAKAVKKQFPRAQLISLGGATECSIWSVLYPIANIEPSWKSIPYGKPMLNQRLYVLDNGLYDCPEYVKGDIYIGGIGLAKEYWHAAELTNNSFIIHPRTGERLYRTGDLGRYLPDGNIEFLGRGDSQVKIQGYRIELGEIEAALKAIAQIKDILVVAQELASGEKQLVAYMTVVSTELSQEELVDRIKHHLKDKLPPYMIPSHFMVIENFPLTANGKVDRKNLPKPNQAEASIDETSLPRNEAERKLAEIWMRILNLPEQRVSIHDDFFDLGGHSISAVRLMTQIKKTFNQELPLSTLYEHHTIASLAKLLSTQQKASNNNCIVAFRNKGTGTPFFCVHAVGGHVMAYQELVKQLDPAIPFYAIQSPHLEGEIANLDTIEKMAEFYLAQLQQMQPQGPYHIGGWSFGGIVAFEMAKQLHQQNPHVEITTVMLDSWAPFYKDGMSTMTEMQLVESFAYDIRGGRVKDATGWDMKPYLTNDLKASMQNLHEQFIKLGILPAGITQAQLEGLYTAYKVNMLALLSYQPTAFDLPVNLIRAQEHPGQNFIRYRYDDQTLGWNNVAKVDVYEVPGNHYTIFNVPNVAKVAQTLALILSC